MVCGVCRKHGQRERKLPLRIVLQSVLRATVRIGSGVTDGRVGSLDRLPSLLTVMACGWAGGV